MGDAQAHFGGPVGKPEKEGMAGKAAATPMNPSTTKAPPLERPAGGPERLPSSVGGAKPQGKTPRAAEVSDGWSKKSLADGGEFEGVLAGGQPKGYGRCLWAESGAYHGEFEGQAPQGKGLYFDDATGDRYEGEFVAGKPCGKGVLTVNEDRFAVEYDGSGAFSWAVPVSKGEAEPEVLLKDSRFTVVAVSRGNKLQQTFKGNYTHCKSVDAKLAYTCPSRANHPLKNPTEIEGKIAVCWRGGGSFAKKVRYCQEAGAVGVIIVGTDDNEKYTQIFQIHEGDPADDSDFYPPGEVAKPVTAKVPVVFSLGRHEHLIRHGAFVRMRFFPGAPGTPENWLLGCILLHPQTIHRDLTRDEADKLLLEFLNQRKEERKQESADLETKLRRKGNSPQKPGETPEMEGREWSAPLMKLMEADDSSLPGVLDNFTANMKAQDVLDLCQEFMQGQYRSMTGCSVPLPFKLDANLLDMSNLYKSLQEQQVTEKGGSRGGGSRAVGK